MAAVPGPAPGAEAAPAQAPGTPTVRLYGKSGTFGQLDGLPSLASGQSLATQAVPGWTFPGGREFWANARTADGSIIVAGGDQMACQACQTSAETAISAFNPSTNSYAVTKLRTTMFNGSGQPIPGVEAPPTPGMVSNTVGDGPEQRGGTSVSDLAAPPVPTATSTRPRAPRTSASRRRGCRRARRSRTTRGTAPAVR